MYVCMYMAMYTFYVIYFLDTKFSMDEINLVLSDEKVVDLWDKKTKKLSENQMAILKEACRSKFLIIHGPPGMY